MINLKKQLLGSVSGNNRGIFLLWTNNKYNFQSILINTCSLCLEHCGNSRLRIASMRPYWNFSSTCLLHILQLFTGPVYLYLPQLLTKIYLFNHINWNPKEPILKILGIGDELGIFGYAKTLLKITSFKFQANPRPCVATADMVQTTPHRASHQEGTRCNDPGTIRTTRTLAGSRK